jgi:hypothetical protein
MFLRNIGFINYFWSIFCKMLDNIFLFFLVSFNIFKNCYIIFKKCYNISKKCWFC